MQTQFRLDTSIANTTIGVFTVGFLLMCVPLVTSGSFYKLATSALIFSSSLILIWIGFARGSFITIDEKNIYGTLFFIRGKVTPIADIVSVHSRSTFGGLAMEIYMKVRDEDGKIFERGLAGKPGLRQSELKKLLEAIRKENPITDIDQHQLDHD